MEVGQYNKAIDYLEKALELSKEIGDKSHEGHWFGNLGIVYMSLEQYDKAIGEYEKAVEISKKRGNMSGEETWIGKLDNAYSKLGQNKADSKCK